MNISVLEWGGAHLTKDKNSRCKALGKGKPETFDVRGLTHSYGKRGKEGFTVLRKTKRKKWQQKLKVEGKGRTFRFQTIFGGDEGSGSRLENHRQKAFHPSTPFRLTDMVA